VSLVALDVQTIQNISTFLCINIVIFWIIILGGLVGGFYLKRQVVYSFEKSVNHQIPEKYFMGSNAV
jgi:hypothetical protein